MFILYENVLTNIGNAERIYPTDPIQGATRGYRIEFEGTVRLGAHGKNYMSFETSQERDRVYANIVTSYGTDISGEGELEAPEPDEDVKKGKKRASATGG